MQSFNPRSWRVPPGRVQAMAVAFFGGSVMSWALGQVAGVRLALALQQKSREHWESYGWSVAGFVGMVGFVLFLLWLIALAIRGRDDDSLLHKGD